MGSCQLSSGHFWFVSNLIKILVGVPFEFFGILSSEIYIWSQSSSSNVCCSRVKYGLPGMMKGLMLFSRAFFHELIAELASAVFSANI